MEMSIAVVDLLTALRMPGCPLRRLRQETAQRSISRMLAEHTNRNFPLAGFVRSPGWGAYHAWMLPAAGMLDWGYGRKSAILREAMDDGEHPVVHIAASQLASPRTKSVWQTADLLSLPHLRRALEHTPDAKARQCVAEDARAKLAVWLWHFRDCMALYGREDGESFSDGKWAAVTRTVAFVGGEARHALRRYGAVRPRV